MFTDIKSKYGITDSLLVSVQSIAEAENEEFDYIAYFRGLKYEFKAKSLWDAKQKATNHFSPPRKEAGMLAVELVNKKGPARIQFEDVEELNEISKETLKNYLVKSKDQEPNLKRNLSIDTQERFDPNLPDNDKIAAEKRLKRTAKRVWNRQVGFHKAVNRLAEEEDTRESARKAIMWRLKVRGELNSLIKKHGLDNFNYALDDVVEPLDDLEEIGSSDISIWTNQLKRTLGEDVEELDELSQKTLISYVQKANDSEQKLAPKTSDGKKDTSANAQFRLPNNIWKKYKNRQKGIDKAEAKLPTGVAYHALTGN